MVRNSMLHLIALDLTKRIQPEEPWHAEGEQDPEPKAAREEGPGPSKPRAESAAKDVSSNAVSNRYPLLPAHLLCIIGRAGSVK